MSLPNIGRAQRFALMILLAYFSTCTYGFFPTSWKEGSFGKSGVSHMEQTEEAFQILTTRYFPTFESLTKSMLRARDTIAKANADVDKDQENAFKHCDGESFDAAQAWLSDIQSRIINLLVEKNPNKARQALGSALHTVQDFYSHSNWVEQGNGSISKALGRGGILAHAGPLDGTCIDCAPNNLMDLSDIHCLDCRDNEYDTISMLTSGYYFGETEPVSGMQGFKCHHGGYTDNVHGTVVGSKTPQFIADPLGGINKDSMNCRWSPHAYAHSDAVSLAIDATVQFIDDIRQKITNSQLRLLFGVGPTLAFVIDTTALMDEIINAVRSSSITLISERLGTVDEPSSYVLLPFNCSNNGPITITTDFKTFESEMQALSVSKEDNCFGLPMTAVMNSIEVLEEGSTVLMFTDAAPKDANLAEAVINAAVAKDIQVVVFKCNSDRDDRIIVQRAGSVLDEAYSRIASGTAGRYYSISRSELTSMSEIISSLTSSNSNFIVRIAGSGGPALNAYRIPVDSYMTQIAFSLHGTGVEMSLTPPTSTSLDRTSTNVRKTIFSNGILVTVRNPVFGYWTVQISVTDSFSLDAYGISTLQLSSFNFVALAGRPAHTGYFPLEGSPPNNADIAVIGSMSGHFSTATFGFRSATDDDLQVLSMEQGSGEFGDPPANSFFTILSLSSSAMYLYVTGLDVMGQPYQRVLPSLVTPTYSNSKYSVDNGTLFASKFAEPMSFTSPLSSRALGTHQNISSAGSSSIYYSNISTYSNALSPTASCINVPALVYYTNISTYSSSVTYTANSTGLITSTYHTNTNVHILSSMYTTGSTPGVSTRKDSTSPLNLSFRTKSRYLSGHHSLNSTYVKSSVDLVTITSMVLGSSTTIHSALPGNMKTFLHGNGTITTYSRISTTASIPSAPFQNSTITCENRTHMSPTPTRGLNLVSLSNMTTSKTLTSSNIASASPYDSYEYTVTEIIYTTTSFCPSTISTSIFGMPTNVVSTFVTTIILTSTIVVPCHECSRPSKFITLPPSVGISATEEYASLQPTAEITVTEIVYTITNLYSVTLSSRIISGTTSYGATTSLSTLTLTITSTVVCHQCGPPYETVTLLLVDISSTQTPSYGPVAASVSQYPTITSTPSLTKGAIPSSVSELSKSLSEAANTTIGLANIVTISLARVFSAYSPVQSSIFETGSASRSNLGNIGGFPANIITTSLVGIPQSYDVVRSSVSESGSASSHSLENHKTLLADIITMSLADIPQSYSTAQLGVSESGGASSNSRGSIETFPTKLVTISLANFSQLYSTEQLSVSETGGVSDSNFGGIENSPVNLVTTSTASLPHPYNIILPSVSETSTASRSSIGNVRSLSISIATISRTGVPHRYSTVPSDVSETNSASRNDLGSIKTVTANMVTHSLILPLRPNIIASSSTTGLKSTLNASGDITQTSPTNSVPVPLSPSYETNGVTVSSASKSPSDENIGSAVTTFVNGISASFAPISYASGGSTGGSELAKPSTLSMTLSFAPENTDNIALGNTTTILSILLPTAIPTTISAYSAGEGTIPSTVLSNDTSPVTPHFAYHGPVYTGSAGKKLRQIGALSLLIAINVCRILL